MPSEREGMALAVGAALLWGKLRTSASKAFFVKISDEVRRCEGVERDFTRDDMLHFVQEVLFNGLTQKTIEQWVQRSTLHLKGEALVAFQKNLVENVMYRYLACAESGADYESVKTLCIKANVPAVLQCTLLGGKAEWTLEDFLSEDAWEQLGGKGGLRIASKRSP